MHQHINNPTLVRTNQIPRLIDLIFTFDDQAINILPFLSPLCRSHYNVITFQYQSECVESSYNYHKADYIAMKSKLSDLDWQELFQGKDVNLSEETFLKLSNDITLKYTTRFNFSTINVKSISG